MTASRRDFLKRSALGVAALGFGASAGPGGSRSADVGEDAVETAAIAEEGPVRKPVVVTTWNFGLQANETAWATLDEGGSALDAVVAGASRIEADPSNHTVGVGGFPDRDGNVTLDACVMDEKGEAGAVAFLRHIAHPVQVARRVMERTPHVMLVGEGALRFALAQGFEKSELLTPEADAAWRKWLVEARYEPVVNIENHDTVSSLALDGEGRLSGCCSTSGLAFKLHGRVGDSPIIGAALFVDAEVGGACATGLGEEVMKTLGSFLVVELMRQGRSPQAACREAIERIVARHSVRNDDMASTQVGYLALDRRGRAGAYAIHPGFSYAVHDREGNRIVAAESHWPPTPAE